MGIRAIDQGEAASDTGAASSQKRRGRLAAASRMRCPECRIGILYAVPHSMNRRCPKCGIRFEREPGYFTGSIWIGVILATPISLGLLCGTMWVFPDLHPALAGIGAVILFSPLLPLTIRIARSFWMYFDHQMQPQKPDRPGSGGGGDAAAAQSDSGPDDGSGAVITSTGESLASIQARAARSNVPAESTS